MARFAPTVAILVASVTLASISLPAQRPALAGEKARVAEAVRADLARLTRLQKAFHDKTKSYAADARDLSFAPSSGAEINIAFASTNAWAANASHATLSPVKCFVIVSAADALDAPTAQPFCTDAEPGTAAGRVAASTATKAASNASRPAPASATPTKAAPPAANPPASRPTTTANPPASTPARQAPPRQQAAAPARQAPANTPATTPNRPSSAAPSTGITPGGGPAGQLPGAARLSTREVIAGASATDRGEAVTAQQFAGVLADFAQSALAVLNAPPPEIVRDPYESTQEFEQRRAAAIAAHTRREAEFFSTNTKTYSVAMTVRNVKYDPDREVLEFAVDPVRLPGNAGGQLSLTCYTRPVFWCSPDTGMIYDAGDLWRVPRATARQHDVLRTPLTLTARYTVGRLEGEGRELAISLVDMELQARGQLVQRWPASGR